MTRLRRTTAAMVVIFLSACGNAGQPSPTATPNVGPAADTKGLLACQLVKAAGGDIDKLMSTSTITDIAVAAEGSTNPAIKLAGGTLLERYDDAAGNLGSSDEKSSKVNLVAAADELSMACAAAGLPDSAAPSSPA